MRIYIPAGPAEFPQNPQIPYLVLDKKGSVKRLVTENIRVDFEDIQDAADAVRTAAQNLTQPQQRQARQNIGFTTAVTSVSTRFGSSMLNYVSRQQINTVYGSFVFLNFSVWAANAALNPGQELGLLPEGFRPVSDVAGSCLVLNASGGMLTSGAGVMITSDGRILYRGGSVPAQTQSPAFIHVNASYIVF
jgi:hypothetical protein